VQVFEYFADFYGDLPDALNAGDPTDRVIARWELLSAPVVGAARNLNLELSPEGIPVALSNANEKPEAGDVPPSAETVTIYLPTDIIQLRIDNSARAWEWRLALREQLQPRLSSGWYIKGFTSDGAYVLTQQK
jgi:predicted GNAT superfamily acetyltransferase